MEIVLVVVAALAGAGAKWLFDRLAAKGLAQGHHRERVLAARHQALEAAQALQNGVLTLHGDLQSALLAATQASNRLIALGDVRSATRMMSWVLSLPLGDEEVAARASEFLLHINDPVDPIRVLGD